MKCICIIQARMGSTRLPGKVLAEIAGEPMLAHVITRCRRAETLDTVVVATTGLPEDDALADVCESRGWPAIRGSATDVLDRYVQAARQFGAQTVVRVTSDCPLIEPAIIDEVVRARAALNADYASNTLPPRTFPRGLDVEACTAEALERAWGEDESTPGREHVTPYLYGNPTLFRLEAVRSEIDHSDRRWTVDTPKDLAFVRAVYAHFEGRDFTWRDVLDAQDAHPEWTALNRHIAQKAV